MNKVCQICGGGFEGEDPNVCPKCSRPSLEKADADGKALWEDLEHYGYKKIEPEPYISVHEHVRRIYDALNRNAADAIEAKNHNDLTFRWCEECQSYKSIVGFYNERRVCQDCWQKPFPTEPNKFMLWWARVYKLTGTTAEFAAAQAAWHAALKSVEK